MVAANRLRIALAARPNTEGSDRAAREPNGGVDVLDVRARETDGVEEAAVKDLEEEVLVCQAELVRGLHGVAALDGAGGARRAAAAARGARATA